MLITQVAHLPFSKNLEFSAACTENEQADRVDHAHPTIEALRLADLCAGIRNYASTLSSQYDSTYPSSNRWIALANEGELREGEAALAISRKILQEQAIDLYTIGDTKQP